MKRKIILSAAVLLLYLLPGCGQNVKETSPETPSAQTGTELAAPEDAETASDTNAAQPDAAAGYDLIEGMTYYFYATESHVQGRSFYIISQLDYCLQDETVRKLKKGSVISGTDKDMFDITVESIEKQDDFHYVVNDGIKLTFDEEKGVWILSDHGFSILEYAGSCTLADTTEFRDTADNGAHKTPRECLAAHESAYGFITVRNGIAEAIEITEVI